MFLPTQQAADHAPIELLGSFCRDIAFGVDPIGDLLQRLTLVLKLFDPADQLVTVRNDNAQVANALDRQASPPSVFPALMRPSGSRDQLPHTDAVLSQRHTRPAAGDVANSGELAVVASRCLLRRAG